MTVDLRNLMVTAKKMVVMGTMVVVGALFFSHTHISHHIPM